MAALRVHRRLATGELQAVTAQIGLLGSAEDLEALLRLALEGDADPALRVAALDALAKAKAERNTTPGGDLRRVAALVGAAEPAIRQAGIRLAGAWGVGEVTKVLVEMASSESAEWSVRAAAIDGLAGVPDGGGKPALRSIVEADLKQLRFAISIYERYDKAIQASEIYKELVARMREELDYRREAAQMALYRHMLADEAGVHVPVSMPE